MGMDTIWSVFKTEIVLLGLYGLAFYLKKKSLISQDNEKCLTDILMKVALPVSVFLGLLISPVILNLMFAPLLVYATAIFGGMIAYLVAEKVLKLNAASTGSLILCSGGGAASITGFALVSSLYSGQWSAFTEAIISMGLGISIVVLVLSIPVAIIFGNQKQGKKVVFNELLKFLYSPIFLAFLLGGLAQLAGLPQKIVPVSGMINCFYLFWTVITAIAAAMLAGFVFSPVNRKIIAGAAIVVVLIKVLLQPLFIRQTGMFLAVDPMWCGVLVMVAAMPSSLFMVVFARKYGCDAPLASALVLVTTLFSLISLPIIYSFTLSRF